MTNVTKTQEDAEGDQGPLGDLSSPGGADQAVGHLVAGNADLLGDGRADQGHLGGRVQGAGLDPHLVAADGVDRRLVEVRHAGLLERGPHVRHRGLGDRGGGPEVGARRRTRCPS